MVETVVEEAGEIGDMDDFFGAFGGGGDGDAAAAAKEEGKEEEPVGGGAGGGWGGVSAGGAGVGAVASWWLGCAGKVGGDGAGPITFHPPEA